MSSPSAQSVIASADTGVISRVSEHPRKPGRYRVRLTDGRSWLIDANAVSLIHRLSEGSQLDSATIEKISEAHAVVSAFDYSVSVLSRSRRTLYEVAFRLRRKGYADVVVGNVIDRLQAMGIADDESVARAEAASRFRKGEGKAKVRAALYRKGISSQLADSVIATVMEEDEIDIESSCRFVAERRLRALGRYPQQVQERRLTAFLLRRGFDGQTVSHTVRGLMREIK